MPLDQAGSAQGQQQVGSNALGPGVRLERDLQDRLPGSVFGFF